MAYLGGFEDEDGFNHDVIRDVSTYNAGQYGLNNGGPGGAFGTITPNSGLFQKFDQGDISEGSGELVTHSGGIFHTGAASLVLRATGPFGDTAGDGADYFYQFDSRDFNGTTPSLVTAGTVSIDYWSCPQTALFATGTVTTTEFLNGNGDTVFALGTVGRGDLVGLPLADYAKPYISYFDSTGWHTTTVIGNSEAWDHVMLSFDLDTDLVSLSYFESLTGITHTLATATAAANGIDRLDGIRFTAIPNTEKNAYDDFTISAPVVIPEPSAVGLALLGAMQLLVFRRRRGR